MCKRRVIDYTSLLNSSRDSTVKAWSRNFLTATSCKIKEPAVRFQYIPAWKKDDGSNRLEVIINTERDSQNNNFNYNDM